jgi:hypothetical protein
MARILRVISSSLALLLTLASLVIIIVLGYPQNLSKYGASNFQTFALVSLQSDSSTLNANEATC